MNEQLIAALAAQNPQLKPMLAAMNGGGDMSALLPMLMSMNSAPQSQSNAPSKSSATKFPSDDEVNMTLKKLQ